VGGRQLEAREFLRRIQLRW